MGKTGVKILFFGRSNSGKETGNLGHVVQIHVCRQVSLMTRPRVSAKYVCVLRLTLTNTIQKKCLYRNSIIHYLQVAEKKLKEIMKITGVLHSNIIKAQNYFFISKRL